MNSTIRLSSEWLLPFFFVLSATLVACDSDEQGDDAGADAGATDAGAMDAGATDAASAEDAAASNDASEPADANVPGDAGMDPPLPTPDSFSPRRIAAYDQATCAVIDGQVACWGFNADGQLGVEGTLALPVEVPGVMDAVTVGVAEDAACAVVESGSVYCWGTDTNASLGGAAPGTVAGRVAPTQVPGITDAREIVGNWFNFCARRADGTVGCWGDHSYGVLVGSTAASETPVEVVGVDDAVEIEAADWGLVAYCALRASGRVSCWGSTQPTVRDMGISGVSRLESVGDGFCARVEGDWYCWGSDVPNASTGAARALVAPTPVADYAELDVLGGIPTTSGSTVCGVVRAPEPHLTCAGGAAPIITTTTRELAGEDFTQLTSFGWTMICGLTPAGGVRCLGGNGQHELGNADAPSAGSAEPVDVTLPF